MSMANRAAGDTLEFDRSQCRRLKQRSLAERLFYAAAVPPSVPAGPLESILRMFHSGQRGSGGAETQMYDERDFEVLPAGEMRRRYGLSAGNRPSVEFSSDDVPCVLREYIPLAKKWGVNDDIVREDMIARASDEERAELKIAVGGIQDELDEWLAGPESFSTAPTEAYLAFTAMRLAADEI